ncbi:MAG: restriction endonuclease subunit S [Gammaproteobacteria bacterium]|nr:restriction endonuclease subunit S [Gammaproteobacteria bacterium]
MSDFSKLSEIAGVVDSLHKTPKYSDVGKPMVRCTDVKYGRLKLDDTFRVSDEVFEEFSRRYKPSYNDIVITRVGSYGITALVEDTNFCLGQNTSVIIPKINPRYLYATLNSPQIKNQIESSVVGSTQKTLSLKAINNLEIPRFDPEIEERIGKIIGELDDKIELNRQINQTLEQIAQAIFKSWFVDFEPVKAKIAAKKRWQAENETVDTSSPTCYAEESDNAQNANSLADVMNRAAMRAISGKSDEELDQLNPEQLKQLTATAALFPDELMESELGVIPKGWEQKRIDDIMELAYGKALKSTDRLHGAVPVYGSGGVTGSHNKSLVDGPGIIVGRKGTVGSLYWEDRAFFPIDTVFYVRTNTPLTFCFYLLQTLGLDRMNTDAAVPGLNRDNVYRLPVVFNAEVAAAFDRIIEHLRNLMRTNAQQSQFLASLRDVLLPKLLSGDLYVEAA